MWGEKDDCFVGPYSFIQSALLLLVSVAVLFTLTPWIFKMCCGFTICLYASIFCICPVVNLSCWTRGGHACDAVHILLVHFPRWSSNNYTLCTMCPLQRDRDNATLRLKRRGQWGNEDLDKKTFIQRFCKIFLFAPLPSPASDFGNFSTFLWVSICCAKRGNFPLRITWWMVLNL